jgi:hypothetical protein
VFSSAVEAVFSGWLRSGLGLMKHLRPRLSLLPSWSPRCVPSPGSHSSRSAHAGPCQASICLHRRSPIRLSDRVQERRFPPEAFDLFRCRFPVPPGSVPQGKAAGFLSHCYGSHVLIPEFFYGLLHVGLGIALEPSDRRLDFSSSRCTFNVIFQSHTQGVR